MAADFSSLVQILSRSNDDRTAIKDSVGPGPRSTVALVTRDFLGSGGCEGRGGGGGGDDQSLELDLDLQVPNGWEKRLDLKTGNVYLKPQCNSKNSSSSTHHHQDLTFSPEKPLLSLFDYTSLEQKLVPSSLSHPLPSSSSSSSNPSLSSLSSLSVSSKNSSFQSVCTLDKVKSALERAEKYIKKRQSPDDGVCEASPVAAGCPRCLTYVLVSKNNPKCPRCHLFVPLPAMKKPKIDLNISI